MARLRKWKGRVVGGALTGFEVVAREQPRGEDWLLVECTDPVLRQVRLFAVARDRTELRQALTELELQITWDRRGSPLGRGSGRRRRGGAKSKARSSTRAPLESARP